MRPFEIAGVGLHTGRHGRVIVSDGEPGTGVVFCRDGVPIRATGGYLGGDARLCTTLAHPAGAIRTVEHLLAAIWAAGQEDIRVEVTGPEIPILDGSAAPWYAALRRNGAAGEPRLLDVPGPMRICSGASVAVVRPVGPEDGPSITVRLDLTRIARGIQSFTFRPGRDPFEAVAAARTFAFESEIAALRRDGFARGGSLRNALVLQDRGVLNPEGMRFADEPARHKVLDALGDLCLLGAVPRAAMVLERPGHHLNHQIVHELGSRLASDCATQELS